MTASDEALLARLRRPRPLLHEWIALAYILGGLALLETMPVSYPRSALLLAYARPIAAILGVAGVIVFLKRRLRPVQPLTLANELVVLGRLALALLLVWPIHFLLKSFIFVINPRTWDLRLAAWDRLLHLGYSPSRFLTTLFDNAAFLHVLDVFYSGVYYFIVTGYTAALLALLPLRRRLAFGVAFLLVWMLGIALYLAMPSWGPVYVFADDFQAVLLHMPVTVSVQRVLYEEISSLVKNPLATRYVRYGCVAAFPSLHLAVVALYAIASRSVSRRWFRFTCGLVVLMALGAVITGYHYMVDVWAGIALGLFCWWIGWLLFVRGSEEDASRAPVRAGTVGAAV
jgi:membrane-associated phospholipid phosphatase